MTGLHSGVTHETMTQLSAYHRLSKHRLDSYAPGPETLDWDDQPNVFRSFDGAPRIALPLVDDRADSVPVEVLFSADLARQPLDLASLSSFLRYAGGLTAWKVLGPDRWSLRANPSSGNLHPTELYLLLPKAESWDAGLYHYDVLSHCLEQRLPLPGDTVPGISLILTSVLQREAWKYGVRGLRYCLLDTGHMLAQCQASAAMLGWAVQLHSIDHQTLCRLTGIRREEYRVVEAEYPELLIRIGQATTDYQRLAELCEQSTDWCSVPSRLGPRSPYNWRECHAMAQAFSATPSAQLATRAEVPATGPGGFGERQAAEVILSRRSAQGYNHERVLSQAEFSALLQPLIAGQSRMQLEPAQLHLLLFVHSVEGVQPGIYLLPRSEQGERLMRSAITRWPEWQPVRLGSGVQLMQLKTANTRKVAAQLCCNQMIAAASACTLMMLAEYEAPLEQQGLAGYQQLYHEAGVLGQALYLSATALGLSGTGIGCFFDDAVHELLGLEGEAMQVVYGFALGEGKQDSRVTGLSGYHHLRDTSNV
ncbi:SagB/ThcOx family dehydrogenase [Marinobacterium sp. D7]|uniref:SagB/ThcOx family dehydrogenase n=1 Tax=Marinobacterium ramblicola TaxID=2849041 RepID=UPI001C2D1721|nr:SagB/ThcOx family dehydrogenase [Marinobacterium ramblicola]MBV1788514.1 SagB/ThcOx family dehydrogenase [Marinobacterium ramblicola]